MSMPLKQRGEVLALLRKGQHTAYDIAIKCHVSPAYVYNLAQTHGLHCPSNRGGPQPDKFHDLDAMIRAELAIRALTVTNTPGRTLAQSIKR